MPLKQGYVRAMVGIFASCPRRSKFAWTTEFTEELIGAWRFCFGATGRREAEGPASGDGDRGGGQCLGGGGVACRVGRRYQGC